jgi:tetratricopeptide (TPR) repeat protein
MFLENRVYQGSSGRVYPLPFTDRIAEKSVPREWEAVYIENEYLRVMIIPALGGRIHRVQEKSSAFDFIYHQPVIKPALVGLAGPWASGGIEFNWPQHHRPSTFMPADVAIERHPGGAMTVWLSEHDPMARMKGMHGVRLHPGRSYLEVVARVYNRTTDVQTFLWWANVAVEAHEQYQSFFPPDAAFVADHAKRAISTFPFCDGTYYGVDYAARARDGVPPDEMPRQFRPLIGKPGGSRSCGSPPTCLPNDLSWYANIPVPTSYMCMGSREDFSGGYDHRARAGLMHVADHHISPGKKQWTWGNAEFGYAWDRNLTDPDGKGVHRPYIELMGGVFTDNQPDFSFLQPGEARTWSQYWYPFRKIGPAQSANVNAALSFNVSKGIARVGIAVTGKYPQMTILLGLRGRTISKWIQDLSPEKPLIFETLVDPSAHLHEFTVQVISQEGSELVAYAPVMKREERPPEPATEPPAPIKVASCDELFLIGLHLEQYRHATRMPDAYWREALRRDPGDARSNMALGRWHLRRGEFSRAEDLLRRSIARLISRNSNPYDGEAFYQLGLCLRRKAWEGALDLGQMGEAYDAFYKATWNQAWQAASFHAMSEIDVLREAYPAALGHLERSLAVNSGNLRARNLKVIVLRALKRSDEAEAVLRETLQADPLDWWARHLAGDRLGCDDQVRLDVALDYSAAGRFREALCVLSPEPHEPQPETPMPRKAPAVVLPDATLGTAPLLHYTRAWLHRQLGERPSERRHLLAAARAKSRYCFPARLDEITILRHAIAENPKDGRAPYYLGNLLYDRRRHAEAIALWEGAVRLEPGNSVAWRNLGIGYFNFLGRPHAAVAAYKRAFAANQKDARLLFESDQLDKRLGVSPTRRLRRLRRFPALVRARDDLSVELCSLCNQAGDHRAAHRVLSTRKFQPWEGGEGLALRQHVRAQIGLGRAAIRARKPEHAVRHFTAALLAPENLGEANHFLADQSDIYYWLGRAQQCAGDPNAARSSWERAAGVVGDFQSPSVRPFSELTFYRAASLEHLGRRGDAHRLLKGLLAFARRLAARPARIDYFATSLPTMLLFNDDIGERQKTTAIFLEAQARLGLGMKAAARRLLGRVLRRDPSHPFAADLPLPR